MLTVVLVAECVYKCSFLESSCGAPYIEAFRSLRLQHIINDFASTLVIEDDNIVPKGKHKHLV